MLFTMSGGRKTQPLFDLMRRGGDGQPPEESERTAMNPGVGWRPGMSPRPVNPPPREKAPKPVIRLELKPESAASVTPARDEPVEPGPAWGTGVLGGSTVRVPVNAIYIASALLIILAMAGWVLGWQMGQTRAGEGASEARTRPPVSEPAELGASRPPAATPTRSGAEPLKASPAAAGPARVEPASGSGLTITAKGMLQGDPREAGLNYLKLAQMTRAESERAVAFLSENGLEAFAVPVDRGGANTNNPDPSRAAYWLFAGRGITTEEFSNRLTARTNTEAAVARLGLRWQKEHRGSSNFSKPGWEKQK